MAEGRMLKRRITASKKLARLKTDKARLLWFYMLPFADVKGRLEADPEDIRDEIIRKQRKGFTIQRIIDCLNDLHNEGMIILYKSNGKQYLQYNRFADEQNLREDREAESKIPGPTTGEVQEQCGGSPPKVKLSKDKLNKDNTTVEAFFNHWNSKKKSVKQFRSHNALTPEMTSAFNERMKDGYTFEQLTAAVDNYALVLGSPDHRVFNVGKKSWDKVWTLREFLMRGTKDDRKEKYLYRFLPNVFVLDEFLTVEAKNSKRATREEVAKKAEIKNFVPGKSPFTQYKEMPLDKLIEKYKTSNEFERRIIKECRPEIKDRISPQKDTRNAAQQQIKKLGVKP